MLSPRKIEILLLVSDGLTHQQIAEQLYLSVRTVETHVYQIQKMLGTKNAAHSVGFFYRNLPVLNPTLLLKTIKN